MQKSQWSDAPIASHEQDTFERAGYAKDAARLLVETHSWNDSIVFGLTGPWGSGKSSMLAMISEEITSNKKKWRVARFTPWATSDAAGVFGDFYATLGSALPKKKRRGFKKKLGILARVSAPAAIAIPWVGPLAVPAVSGIGRWMTKSPPWDVAFQKAAAELKKLETPVLIIVDDIDRLQSDELLALLKVVRLLGRFPGVQFLLAYDEETLFRVLGTTSIASDDIDSASKFLEKIVQYPLTVPPLSQTQLLKRLDEGIDSILKEIEQFPVTTSRLSRLITVYLELLGTPRAIDRFLAQLQHHLPLIEKGEFDVDDLVMLTLLRVTFPILYQDLPRWRQELITGHTDELVQGDSSQLHAFFEIGQLLTSVPCKRQASAKTLLISLFPNLDQKKKLKFEPPIRRVSHRDYFDRYFALGIPSQDVSDNEVEEAIRRASRGEYSLLRLLLTTLGREQTALVIDKLRNSTELEEGEKSSDIVRLHLLRAVLPTLGLVPSESSLFLSPYEHLIYWSSKLLEGCSSESTVAEILEVLAYAPSPRQQIEVIWKVKEDDQEIPWRHEVIQVLSKKATVFLMEHLKAKDAAEENAGFATMLYFLRSEATIGEFTDAVQSGIESSEFAAIDIAARLVSTSRLLGTKEPTNRLGEFHQEIFEELVDPATEISSNHEIVQVDTYDLSWRNRKLFAMNEMSRSKSVKSA